ncbi:divergent polysaccharide deacetylase family protein [Campylobacter sp.]|uniref:divergent polysaccharide deacetylase family protein n=1 Tax=Campylobacter sp. TaxID=205 RepID=UPI0026F886B6|nr:divergent polysaccharide deacetylase family protein [Campylobacter sp.]
MSPKTKKKTTKKRVTQRGVKTAKKKPQKHAFWSYFKIIIACIVTAGITYFALSQIYSARTDQGIINKIERYFDKQKLEQKREIVKQEPPKKEPAVKFEPKPQIKPEVKPQFKQEIKPPIQDETVKEKPQPEPIKDTHQSHQAAKDETISQDNETKILEENQSKKKGGIHIEVFDKEGVKKDERRIGDVQIKPKPSDTLAAKTPYKPPLNSAKLSGKPKLVIIIDDVAHKHQVDAIKSINLRLTPSFFPATKDHPDTPKLAKKFSFYMIHLPLQAKHFKGEEIDTLRVNDSYEKISKRLRTIKRDFPNLIYINNHTGSKFTSDFDAMDRLMKVIKNENLIFIDSKTIADTKVAAAAKKHSMPYISRDVFLDHEDNKASITKQLRYAVSLAKKHSKAIAIGHPYKNTMDVLRNSSEILKDVEVVYLKDIF